MTPGVPVTQKYGNISIWQTKGNRNNWSIVYDDSSISSCSFVEVKGREVEKAPYLIFNLKLIRPIPPCWNGAISS